MLFWLGAQPYGETFAEQPIVGGRIGDQATAGCEHEAGIFGQDRFERLAFHAAITAGSVEIKNNAEGDAGVPFDLFVEFDEGHTKDLGEQAAKRRLTGAAQACEGDTEAAGSRIGAAKPFQQEFVSVAKLGGRKLFQELRGLFKGRSGRLAVGNETFDGYVQCAGDLVQANDGNVGKA